MGKKGAKGAGILSMDAIGLTNYARKRFDKNLLGTEDFEETRDLAFQILAHKHRYEESGKLHLKLSYTLIQAKHNGFFNKIKHIGFPYLDNYYKLYYNTTDGSTITGSRDLLLYNTGQFILENTLKTINRHLENNFEDLVRLPNVKDTFSKLKDCDLVQNYINWIIYGTSFIQLLKLWTKDNIPTELTKSLACVDAGKINITDSEIIHLSHYIELYCCMIALNVYNDKIISDFIKTIEKFYNQFDNKTKVLLFFTLSNVEYLRNSDILMKLFFSTSQNIKLMELNDVLLVLRGMESLSYKQRLLDDIVTIHLIPKLSKLRFEDLIAVLNIFISLDYRCSSFLELINNDFLLNNRTATDLSVLSIKLNQLRQPIGHLLNKLSYNLNNLAKATNINVIKELDKLYCLHQTRNEFLQDWLNEGDNRDNLFLHYYLEIRGSKFIDIIFRRGWLQLSSTLNWAYGLEVYSNKVF